jgi:hypothetical protein
LLKFKFLEKNHQSRSAKKHLASAVRCHYGPFAKPNSLNRGRIGFKGEPKRLDKPIERKSFEKNTARCGAHAINLSVRQDLLDRPTESIRVAQRNGLCGVRSGQPSQY